MAQSPAAPFSWTGLYVGAGIGGGAAIIDQSLIGAGFSDSSAAQGFLATVATGYDYRLNRHIVAGAFFDYDLSGISTDSELPIFFSSAEHRYSWAVGARVGYLVNPATLLYVATGFTRAGFDFDMLGRFNFSGYFLGAGVEAQIAGNWALRGEYRFTQFDSKTVDDGCGCGIGLEPSMHTGRVLLIYRFNDGGSLSPL